MEANPLEYADGRPESSAVHGPSQWLWSSAGLLNVWPYRVIRVSFALIFLWSGIVKLFNPTSFVVIIDSYGLIPDDWNMPVALSLAAIEALVGFALLFDIRGALAIVAALLCLFMAILGYGIWLGLDIDCGCFGPEDPEAKAYHGLRSALLRDSIMIFGIVYLYAWRFGRSVRPVSISYWINQILDRRRMQ